MTTFENLRIQPIGVYLYVPPIVWKGDAAGHIGSNDVFFWVLEGECFLSIDSRNYIVRPGQLAFLPKGKLRAYTHTSPRFSMYEMAFSAETETGDLMEQLGLRQENFVVDIPEREEMSALFETSGRKEMKKDPLYDVGWCANILNMIRIYAAQRRKLPGESSLRFQPVLAYMSSHIRRNVTVEELAALAYMQPTYFIKQFSREFGIPPKAYFSRQRVYTAMGLLAGTDHSIEQIATEVGISDTSYFARLFKKHCGVSPTEYRAAFRRDSINGRI